MNVDGGVKSTRGNAERSDAEQRDAGERREDAPAEAAEDVAPRPQAAQRRPLARALLALVPLLDAALVGDVRLLLGR